MIGEYVIGRLLQLGELAEADRAALQDVRGTVRDCARGEDVLRKGDHPDHAVVVLSGLLHRYTVAPQGERQIHSFYIPGDTPCLETLHIGVLDNSLAATAASRIGLIPHAELFTLMAAHPGLCALFWRETLVQASIFREWLMRNSQMPAHARLAHLFCEMMARARAAGIARGESCALPITQEDLADALGMSTVHANRTLMLLRAGGMVEFQRGVLTIGKWDQLAELAEFDPAYLHLHAVPAAGAIQG